MKTTQHMAIFQCASVQHINGCPVLTSKNLMVQLAIKQSGAKKDQI